MRWILGLLLAAVVAGLVTIQVASEYGGEVVTLRTRDTAGVTKETRLWIVEIGPDLWLRSGPGESGWMGRMRAEPEVEVVRHGQARLYKAVPVPHMTPEVDQRMAEKYGLADRVIGLIRDPQKSIAVRLDPLAG